MEFLARLSNKQRFQLLYVVLIFLALPFTMRAVQQRSEFQSSASTACTINGMSGVFYYGAGEPTSFLYIGGLVEVLSPGGDLVGCFTVTSTGYYGMMPVYSRIWDSSIGGYKDVLNPNDPLTFMVDGVLVGTNPSVVAYPNNNADQVVNLTQLAQPTPTVTPIPPTATPTPIPDPSVCDQRPAVSFSNYYGESFPSTLLPVGAVVNAYNPRGERAGCIEVTREGLFPFLRVWGEYLTDGIPGMREGEPITFKVVTDSVQTLPSNVTWHGDGASHFVQFLSVLDASDNLPRVLGRILGSGRLERAYKTQVIGVDDDLNDSLGMKLSGLPEGLQQGECLVSREDRAQIKCEVKGTPIAMGTFSVSVLLMDDRGGVSQRALNLTIRK